MGDWVVVCRLSDLPAEHGLALDVGGHRLAVFRWGDAVHVLSGRCPHAGGPLGYGRIEEGEAVCPLHHWRFRLRDGRCTTVRGEWVRVYNVELRADEVWVRL